MLSEHTEIITELNNGTNELRGPTWLSAASLHELKCFCLAAIMEGQDIPPRIIFTCAGVCVFWVGGRVGGWRGGLYMRIYSIIAICSNVVHTCTNDKP